MADTPQQAQEALTHINAALTANSDAMGAVQNNLYEQLQGALDVNQQFVDAAQIAMKRTLKGAIKPIAKGTNLIVQQLGGQISGTMADTANATNMLAQAAVGMAPQAASPPAGGGATPLLAAVGFSYYIVYNCTLLYAKVASAADMPSLAAQGWQVAQGYTSIQAAAADLINFGPDWVKSKCPQVGGGGATGGGGTPQPTCFSGTTQPGTVPVLPPTAQLPPVPVAYAPHTVVSVYVGCVSGLVNWLVCAWTDPVNVPNLPAWASSPNTSSTITPYQSDGSPPSAAVINAQLQLNYNAAPNTATCGVIVPTLPSGGGGDVTLPSGGGACPPPTVCPPPATCPTLPTVPPPAACGDFPVPEFKCNLLVDGKLPQVGSVDWCACIKDIADWLDAIGQWFACQIDDITGAQSGDVGAVENAANAAVVNVVAQLLPTKIIDLAARVQQRQGTFWGGLKSAIAQFAAVTSTRLLGLALARAAIHVFKQIRVGWDLAVWGTVDIEIIIDPLDKMLVYVEQYIFQWEIPGVAEAIECYLFRTTTDEQVACWMACHGANWDTYSPVIRARREKLTTEELIQVNRRSNLDDEMIAGNMRALGWIDEDEVAQRIELSYELPTIQDHLHWLQRNVFDHDYVRTYNLLDGFAPDAEIAQIIGLPYTSLPTAYPKPEFWATFGHDLHALGMREEYAANHFAAHWITPSVGQLAEMMQRLRPGRVDQSIAFKDDDFSRLLVEQDVAPWFRERLKAIAFRTIPLRQLNSATQQGRFDRDELVNRWQDIGFTEADSETLADTSLVQAARQVASGTHAYTAALVSEMAQFGAITLAEAVDKLTPQGYTIEQITTLVEAAQARRRLGERKKHDAATVNTFATLALQAYEDGAVDQANASQALVKAGYSNDAAQLALSTVDLRVRKATVDLAVSTVHKGFRLGATDPAGALNALALAGVTQQMAQVFVARWQLERSIPHVAAATAAILRWTRKGIMSVAQAAIRLTNLGWAQDDINLQLLEVQQEASQAQAKAAATKAAALVKAQAQAAAAIRSSQRGLCRIYSPSKMIRWYKERIIDESEFRKRLAQCGYQSDAIDDLFKEATVALAAADKKAEKAGATGIEYTGQGAVAGGPAP